MRRSLLVAATLLLVLCLPPPSFGADPTLEQLAEIQARQEAAIMALPGVIGIGIGKDNDQDAFVVYVDKDAPMPALPASLEGVPVVAQPIGKIVTHHGGRGCIPCHAAQLPLPTPMGHSGSNSQLCYACTLGFKVCDPVSGIIGFVTNNHCNPGANGCENGPLGVPFFERALGDNGCVLGGLQNCGTTQRVKTLVGVGNKVDAAFVRSSNAQSSRTVEDIGRAGRRPGSVAVGECVRKSGRTTGLTFGRVNAVNVTVNVGGYCQGTIQFVQQITYQADTTCGQCSNPAGSPPCPVSLGGDSGSPVLKLDRRKVVALNFAGTPDGGLGVGNTAQNVLSELGVTLNLRQCPGGAALAAEAGDEEDE